MSPEFIEPGFPPLGHPVTQDRQLAGSKAAALSALMGAGFPVPPGFVVTGTFRAEALAGAEAGEQELSLQAAARAAGPGPYAVRSSAVEEDLPGASFAGMYESYLNVAAVDLAAAVERCFASANAERVRAYEASLQSGAVGGSAGEKGGLDGVPGGGMAVLVQQMVDPVAAGVAFTANPLTGDRGETVLTAVPGLAESLVSGVETGDEWLAGAGRPRLVRGPGSVLSEERATTVIAAARRIAGYFGCPQDIEWAMDHSGNLLILQARPMTALPDPVQWEPPGKGAWIRNFRLGEWLPEPVTPLFLDWLVPRIDAGYNEAVRRSLGVDVPMRFGAVNGWYYVSPPTPRALPRLLFGGTARSLPYFYNSVARPLFDPAGADRTVLAALEHQWRTDCLPSYRTLVETAWPASATASLAELIGMVNAVAWKAGEYLWLFAATGGAAWKMELALARFWRRHLAPAPARRGTAAQRPGHGYQVLLGGLSPALPQRTPHAVYSIDWYHPTAGEHSGQDREPGGGPYPDNPAALPAAERRRAAEAACRAILKGTGRLARFESLLSVAQHYAMLREEQVRDFTLGWPLLRRCATEMGTRLRDRGIIGDPEDVYFLTLDVVRLDAPAQHAVVEARRKEWHRQRKLAAPLQLGKLPPLLGNTFDRLANTARSTTDLPAGALVGHPASPGRARGRVRIVDGPGDFGAFLPGEVLVAKATAPAWTPLFAAAVAVVTDGGTLAAHASLVAREYGIPAVVGTGNATQVLRTGDMVTVDGNAGTVEGEPLPGPLGS